MSTTPSDNPFGTPAAGEGMDENFNIDIPVDEGFRIKAGKYPGKLISLDKSTSAAGNPMWIFTFVLLTGPGAGREFKTYCALTPSAMWKVREVLEALKLGSGGQTSNFKKSDAIGKIALLDMVDSEYKGRKNSEIATVLPMTDEQIKEAQAEIDKAAQQAKGDIPF